jgi:beta-N-acetylhexosaminidase
MSPRALHRQVGQLAMAGFDGHTVPVELRALAREFDLGGVILFRRNVESPEQVAELSLDLRSLSPELPVWIGIDQEGGRVARLRRPFTEWPPMVALGRSGDERLAERFGRSLAAELGAVGVSIDFAPVLDVNTNAANPVIGDRALGDRAELVARLGAAVIRGLQGGGVAACGKHFPGHGDTSVDSHLALPIVEHPPERFRAVDFVPFRAAIEARVASIMVAHLLVPVFDEERPASLSRRIVRDILRDELCFDGLIVTDDLEMHAVAAAYSLEQATAAAIAAGCDLVLLCGTDHNRQASAIEAIVRGLEAETISFGEIDSALQRHRRVKERFLASPEPRTARDAGAVSPLSPDWRPPSPPALRAIIASDEHRAIADEIARYV